MVATKKKTTTVVSKTTKGSSVESSNPKELKLKKVKKNKKPSIAAASVIAVGENGSSSSVVIRDAPKKQRVEINMEELEAKERLETQEIQTLTVTQLKKLCKTRKVGGYSGKKKEQIMNLLVPAVS